jgi:hypothetical protein
VSTRAPTERRRWTRFLFYRRESLRTTWTFRLGAAFLVAGALILTRGYWTLWIGRSLVCTEEIAPSDAIVVENFDSVYLVFEEAATLQRSGLAPRVLVPTEASRDGPGSVSVVYEGIAEVMARVAHLRNPEIIPVREDREPISLNAVYQVRDFLIRERLRSVIVVAPAFRSRRSSLIYGAVLTPAGIQTHCVPVFGEHTLETWSRSWHGIEDVGLQFAKLQFYRFNVLPRAAIRRE